MAAWLRLRCHISAMAWAWTSACIRRAATPLQAATQDPCAGLEAGDSYHNLTEQPAARQPPGESQFGYNWNHCFQFAP